MIDLVLRNLELFFRDKTTVIMSLLAEIIIMILYIIFMRDNLMESFGTLESTGKIMDTWMISGILGITPVTASMSAYGIMIDDKARKKDIDFNISPLGGVAVVSGYLFSASLAGIVLSMTVFLLSEAYMLIFYGIAAGTGRILDIYMMMIIDSICCSALMLLPVSFLKSSNALAGCCTILGALIGFMTGIYLPIGSVDGWVGTIVKSFPVSHGVVVFRQLLTEPVLKETLGTDIQAAAEFMEYMGIRFMLEEKTMSENMSVMFLAISAAISLLMVFTYQLCHRRRH